MQDFKKNTSPHQKDMMESVSKEYNDVLIQWDDFLKWHPHFDIASLQDTRYSYAISIDLAEGNNGDYDIFNIFQVVPMSKKEIDNLRVYEDEYSFFKMIQVGVFRCNNIPLEDFAKYCYHLLLEVFYIENVKIVIENNYEGRYFRKLLTTIYGDENEIEEDALFVRFPKSKEAEEIGDNGVNFHIGLTQNEYTKSKGCGMAKAQINSNQIILMEFVTIMEASSFAKNPKKKGLGSYECMLGNDDAIMSVINLSHIRELEEWVELCDIISPYCTKEFYKILNTKLNTKSDDEGGDISDFYV